MTDSLRDTIAAAVDDQKTSHEPDVEEVEEETQQEDDNSPHTDETPDEDHDSPQEEKSESGHTTIKAPRSWSHEDREAFDELDPRAQRQYLKRYKEMQTNFTRKQKDMMAERQLALRVRESLKPFEAQMKQHNVDPVEAFQRAASAHTRLLSASPQEKLAILQKWAIDYGIPLQNMMGAEPQQQQYQQQQQYVDPQLAPIYQTVQQQNQVLRQLVMEKEQAQVSSLQSTIDQFANKTNKFGEPLHPHFDEVRVNMGKLINAGQAEDLEDAYEKAVLLNKNLRKEYISAQNGSRVREDETRSRTEASKRAGFNVKGGSSGNSIADTGPALSLNETIRQSLAAQMRRR